LYPRCHTAGKLIRYHRSPSSQIIHIYLVSRYHYLRELVNNCAGQWHPGFASVDRRSFRPSWLVTVLRSTGTWRLYYDYFL